MALEIDIISSLSSSLSRHFLSTQKPEYNFDDRKLSQPSPLMLKKYVLIWQNYLS